MTLITLPNDSSISGNALWSEVYNNDVAIATVVNGQLQNENLSASAAIADSKLASANNSVYKTILQASGVIGNDATAKTFLMTGSADMPVSGVAEAVASITPPASIRFASADYAVGSLTTKLRLRALVFTNATAPACTFTFTMVPLTVAGAADNIAYTAGSAVSGSSTAIATPGASAATAAATASDFGIPADGAYGIACTTDLQIANNALVSVHAVLQLRNT